MGRRQRIRIRKRNTSAEAICLDNDPKFIKLRQWMSKHDWQHGHNTKLALFYNTGRGVICSKNLKIRDALAEIPYELMITFTTLESLFLEAVVTRDSPLEIHDLLSLFLIIEYHKGSYSPWKPYIDSLPTSMPKIPWLCSLNEMTALPDNLKVALIKRRNSFDSSWERLKRSINSRRKCECCQMPFDRVITYNLFTWAYVMVNTRAVYVDPNIVRELSSTDSLNSILSDEPCMALCPYLDMFNHSNTGSNDAGLVQINGKWFYRLITLVESKKYKEAFISYGSHDNFKLLCEYGFFIPNYELDNVIFDLNDILKVSKMITNERQYRFIIRKFNESLYVSKNGASFNLKAVIFVMLNPHIVDYCSYIFNEYSEEHLRTMDVVLTDLLNWKHSEFERVIRAFATVRSSSYFEMLLNYLKYQLGVIKELLSTCTINR